MSRFDPRTKQCELEVQKIIHLQNLANQLPNAFTDAKKVTRSHVPATNAPIKIDVPVGQSIANESKARLKRGRPIGSKDKNPRKRKGAKNTNGQIEDNQEILVTPEEPLDDENVIISKETRAPEICENHEISINYTMSGIRWDRSKVNIDNVFAYNVAIDVMNDNEDHEPKSIKECKQRCD